MNTPTNHGLHPRSDGQRFTILLLAILQIVATLLPQLGWGEPIGDRSDVARTAITPAGWAFSIWGPLFAGSILYALYQFAPNQRSSPLLARIGWLSAGAFLGNAVWAIYTQTLGLNAGSALIIGLTLLCLLVIYRAFAAQERFSPGERFLVVLPLSALGAWLTAATIVNIAASLKYHGVDVGPAAPTIAAAIVIIGGIIAATALWRGRGNPWYALVFMWALAGIYSAAAPDLGSVRLAAILAAILVAGAALARLTRRNDRDHWFSGGAAGTSAASAG